MTIGSLIVVCPIPISVLFSQVANLLTRQMIDHRGVSQRGVVLIPQLVY